LTQFTNRFKKLTRIKN